MVRQMLEREVAMIIQQVLMESLGQPACRQEVNGRVATRPLPTDCRYRAIRLGNIKYQRTPTDMAAG